MGEDLFYAVLVGATLGFIFDFFRLPRLVFNDKFFFDFLFWIISSIVVFCYYLIFNFGSIRILNFLLIFIGFLLYTFTLGYVTKGIEIKLAKKIKFWLKKVKIRIKSFKKVLQSLYSIYYNITARIRGSFHKKSKDDGYDNEDDKSNEKEDFF